MTCRLASTARQDRTTRSSFANRTLPARCSCAHAGPYPARDERPRTAGRDRSMPAPRSSRPRACSNTPTDTVGRRCRLTAISSGKPSWAKGAEQPYAIAKKRASRFALAAIWDWLAPYPGRHRSGSVCQQLYARSENVSKGTLSPVIIVNPLSRWWGIDLHIGPGGGKYANGPVGGTCAWFVPDCR